MGISVESVLLGAGLPVRILKPRARANGGPVSEGRGSTSPHLCGEGWWGKSLGSRVVDLETVQLKPGTELPLICCRVSQPALCYQLWVAHSCQGVSPWVPSVLGAVRRLLELSFYHSVSYSQAWKKAVDACSSHMTQCGLIV